MHHHPQDENASGESHVAERSLRNAFYSFYLILKDGMIQNSRSFDEKDRFGTGKMMGFSYKEQADGHQFRPGTESRK